MAKQKTEIAADNSLRKQDLINFLTKKFGGQDGKLVVRNISTYNLEEALYWFAVNHGSELLKEDIQKMEFTAYVTFGSKVAEINYLYKALIEEFVYGKE